MLKIAELLNHPTVRQVLTQEVQRLNKEAFARQLPVLQKMVSNAVARTGSVMGGPDIYLGTAQRKLMNAVRNIQRSGGAPTEKMLDTADDLGVLRRLLGEKDIDAALNRSSRMFFPDYRLQNAPNPLFGVAGRQQGQPIGYAEVRKLWDSLRNSQGKQNALMGDPSGKAVGKFIFSDVKLPPRSSSGPLRGYENVFYDSIGLYDGTTPMSMRLPRP